MVIKMEKEKTTALDIALGVAGGLSLVPVGIPLLWWALVESEWSRMQDPQNPLYIQTVWGAGYRFRI